MRKNQNNCILSCDKPLGTQISLFYCYDINVFPIDYAQWELCNMRLILVEDNSRNITIQEQNLRNNNVTVITRGRLIDDNLKSQIKNRTLHTCRLFVHLPILFLRYTWKNKFRIFSKIELCYFTFLGTLSTLNLPIKRDPSSKQLLYF